MAVADLVAEWFDNELLRATIAAQGIFGTFLGPWSAGSGATFLLRAAADGNPAGGATYVMGGTGALTTAMAIAAQAAGVEIRIDVEVSQIKVKDGMSQRASCCATETRSKRALSYPMPIPNGRCSAWSIHSISRPASCSGCSITA